MLGLTLGPSATRKLEVLCIGAHCDDIEIGCGGTVIAVQDAYPQCTVHLLVLTSTPARRAEALVAAKDLIKASSRGEVRICALPDGLLPAHLAQVKAEFERLKSSVEPDLILTHCGSDQHQDHSLVSQVTWQTFRNHMIWEYEIPKYDGDLVTPNLYVPMPVAFTTRKIELVMRAFRSQHGKPWFKAENLEALMRLRGLECRAESGFAEGFHCRKLVGGFAAQSSTAARSRTRRR